MRGIFVIIAIVMLPMVGFSKEAGNKQRKPASIECPEAGTDGALEKTVSMIKAAASCYEADQIATQCGWGSSADTQIAGAAGDVCANAFRGKLTPEDKKMYQALIKKCQKKYAGKQGTIYISGEAFCEEGVGKLFSDLYTPAD